MRLEALRRCGVAVALLLAACGGGEPQRSAEERAPAPQRETVFDPLTSTLDRAQSVQQTIDEQAAEQRRRLEAAER